MNTSRQVLPLARLCARQFSKTGIANAEKVEEVPAKAFYKLKDTQKRFGIDDGVPVFLKSGPSDKILYLATSFAVIFGLGLSGHAFYKLATK